MRRAVSILNAGGAEYEAYREGFQNAQPAYDIQRVNTAQFNQGIESQYQRHSSALKADHALESQYGQSTESITQKGQSLGLKEETFNEFKLKNEVAESHKDAGIALEIRRETHAEKIVPLEEKVDTGRDETVLWGNIKQIWNSGS